MDNCCESQRFRFVIAALWILLALLVGCTVKPAGELTTPLPATPTSPPTISPFASPAAMTSTFEAPATAAAIEPPEAAHEEYIVQAGDTLLGLAAEWDVPMAAIQRLNNMGDSTVVKVGLPLDIPSGEGWEGASRFWVLHVVKEGETLSHIARRYDLTVARLQEVNGLSDSDAIRVGQELILPLEGPAETGSLIPTTTPRSPTRKKNIAA